jgi:hypothetical protein
VVALEAAVADITVMPIHKVVMVVLELLVKDLLGEMGLLFPPMAELAEAVLEPLEHRKEMVKMVQELLCQEMVA